MCYQNHPDIVVCLFIITKHIITKKNIIKKEPFLENILEILRVRFRIRKQY